MFDVEGREVGVEVTSVVIAGWTGRNKEAVQHHIDELVAIGVAPPSTMLARSGTLGSAATTF